MKEAKTEEKKKICDLFELLFSKFEEITKKEEELPPQLEKPQNRLMSLVKWNKYHD